MSDHEDSENEQWPGELCLLCNQPLLFLCRFCETMAWQMGVPFTDVICATFRSENHAFHRHCLERTMVDYLRFVTGQRWFRFH